MSSTSENPQSTQPPGSEADFLQALRASRRQHREVRDPGPAPSPGQKVADAVAATMGSWPFIIVQTVILAGWVLLNAIAYTHRWDPYPFILLNLALSFQAAYAAPIIMMSQNRQQDIDRQAAANDYMINIKAELEIEALHHKLDHLREIEVLQLSQTVQQLATLLEQAIARAQQRDMPENHADDEQ